MGPGRSSSLNKPALRRGAQPGGKGRLELGEGRECCYGELTRARWGKASGDRTTGDSQLSSAVGAGLEGGRQGQFLVRERGEQNQAPVKSEHGRRLHCDRMTGRYTLEYVKPTTVLKQPFQKLSENWQSKQVRKKGKQNDFVSGGIAYGNTWGSELRSLPVAVTAMHLIDEKQTKTRGK